MIPDLLIEQALADGELLIDPFTPGNVQPASVDLTLGDSFSRGGVVQEGGVVVVEPGEFLLAHTRETIGLSNRYAARFEGKSTWGRRGLLTHISAGFIDPGFTGQLTLELFNVSGSSISLVPGVKIGQIAFFRLVEPARIVYGSPCLGSHYQNQQGVTEAFEHE